MMVLLVGPTANLIEIQVPSNFEYLVRLGCYLVKTIITLSWSIDN